ncbi:MAG: replicative DNA helicase, partial [Emergencia sp.]
STLSRYLKLLAREMDCPVIVLSQLSRAPEQRQDHRPILSDLRESGSIEQDADVVMFLYRDDYYNPDNSEKPGVCEVNLAKHRSGPTEVFDLTWVARYTKFSDKA